MTCVIVSRHLKYIPQDQIDNIVTKSLGSSEASLVLSIIANPDEKLEYLVNNIFDNNLSDLCIINNEEIRIRRVLSLMKEKQIENQRIYFLRLNRILN